MEKNIKTCIKPEVRQYLTELDLLPPESNDKNQNLHQRHKLNSHHDVRILHLEKVLHPVRQLRGHWRDHSLSCGLLTQPGVLALTSEWPPLYVYLWPLEVLTYLLILQVKVQRVVKPHQHESPSSPRHHGIDWESILACGRYNYVVITHEERGVWPHFWPWRPPRINTTTIMPS